MKRFVIASIFLIAFHFSFSQSRWLDSLLSVKNIHDTTIISEINRKGFSLLRNSPDSAILYYQKAISIAQGSRHKERKIKQLQANATRFMGIANRQQGNHALALDYYQKAILLMTELDDKEGIANCFSNWQFLPSDGNAKQSTPKNVLSPV